MIRNLLEDRFLDACQSPVASAIAQVRMIDLARPGCTEEVVSSARSLSKCRFINIGSNISDSHG
jgi:hypothetical protein